MHFVEYVRRGRAESAGLFLRSGPVDASYERVPQGPLSAESSVFPVWAATQVRALEEHSRLLVEHHLL